ncbi:MAG: O-antigen ligase family protein [Okeania sp. SIO3C4]|nr:O-antigen ligase family protein [Okeania sp. SIO3C4]
MENTSRHRQYKITRIVVISVLSVFFLGAAMLFGLNNMVGAFALLILPFVILFVAWVFKDPLVGYISLLYANYFALGLARYVPGPLGLSVDGLLMLTWLSIFFSQYKKKVDWKRAANSLTLVSAVWFAYALFQLVNPEAVSRVAWFYAMRGVSLYMILTVPLVFVLLDSPKHLDTLLKLWTIFTIVGVLKGMMQKFVGVDFAEKYWLDTVGGKTHRLSQGLRIFSFFSDAATYGGSMGFSSVTFAIVALHTKEMKKKVFFAGVSVMALYAMLISGTRGAIAVPFGGFGLYAVLSKRVKIVALGGFAMIAVYSFLKFTTIGDSVYEIRRFRDALDPNNPSLQVRKDNQKKLKVYLASRPFGGGIGSAGNWGLRFSPGTFLAETPTDSWYVQIWAEQGIVGLGLHLGILFFVLGKSAYIIMFRLKSDELIGKGAALSAGMFGIMAASYGSGALGQMPNGIIVYSGMAFIFMMPRWEERANKESIES